MAEGMTDAEVFGTTTAPPPSSGGMTDEEVFGSPPPRVSAAGVPTTPPTWGLPSFLRRDPNAPKSDPLPVITDPESPFTVETRLRLPDAPPPGPPPAKTPWTEDNPAFAAGDPREALPPSNVDWKKVGGAVREGWNGPVSLLPPGSDDAGQERLYGPYVGGAINTLFRFPLGLPNAVLYGAAEFANQVTGDPRAGRDVMRLAEMLPMHGGLGGPRVFAEPPVAPRVAPLMESFNRMDAARAAETPRPDTVWPLRINDEPVSGSSQAPGAAAPAEPPTAPPAPGATPTPEQTPPAPPIEPQPGPEPAPAGGAAGADVTRDPTLGRSRREQAGSQADMEMADLMRTPQPNDARDIIPGATQTKAEIELSPATSREAKGLRQEFREGFNEHEKDNNEIYHRWVDDVAPPREQTATAKDTREAQWKEDEKTAFGPKRVGEQVSAEDVVNHMRDVLSDPVEQSNSYLKKAFQPFIDMLTDAEGNPKTMGAKELYGVRQEMGRRVKDMATDPDLAHVRDQFGDLLDVTDGAITSGAPEYRTMMDNYRQASIGINEAERLQDMRLKITNGSDRVITFGALDRYMKTLWMERHGPNRYAPAKDISPETWDHLMQLHERLARSASADELAKTKGSDTTQLMMEMTRKGAIGAAHLAAAKLTGGLGNIAIPYITKGIDERRAQRQVGRHLNPDLRQYPPVVP